MGDVHSCTQLTQLYVSIYKQAYVNSLTSLNSDTHENRTFRKIFKIKMHPILLLHSVPCVWVVQHTEHPIFHGEDSKGKSAIKSEFSASQALENLFHDLFSFIQLGEGQFTEKKNSDYQWDTAKLYVSEKETPCVILFRLHIFVFFYQLS